MRHARSETGQQSEAATTAVDKQINDLPDDIAKEETVKPVPKARPKRVGRGRKERRRVVVTGIGAVTPLGLTVNEYWQGLVEGRSGIGDITRCDVSGLSCQIAGEVKGFEPRDYMDHKEARRMARFSQFVVAASRMAMEEAGLDLSRENPDCMGVLIGNGIGGFPEAEEGCRTLIEKGGMRMNPFFMQGN